jgi:hypothetical protein
MEPKPRLTLEEGPGISRQDARRQGGKLQMMLLVMILFCCVFVVVYLLTRRHEEGPRQLQVQTGSGQGLELVNYLERLTLYSQAGDVLERHLEQGDGISQSQRARLLLRLGKLRQRAFEHAQAVRAFLEAERLGLSAEEQRELNRIMLDSLVALGKREIYEEELRRRFTYTKNREDDKHSQLPATEKVLALVGKRRITEHDLKLAARQQAEKKVDLELMATLHGGKVPTPEEREKAIRREIKRILSDGRQRKQLLEELVIREMLYQEAVQRRLDDEFFQQASDSFRRDFLAQRALRDYLLSHISITEQELLDEYERRRDQFVRPARVKLLYASFNSHQEAESFLVEQKQKMVAQRWKELPQWLSEGQPIPGIGESSELTAHIFALKKGEMSSEPVKFQDTYYVFRVTEKQDAELLPFEQVRAKIITELYHRKYNREMEAYLKQLKAKYRVVIEEEQK